MVNHNPKVSIIIPVYNGSNFLSNAIESALAQTYRNIEIIVVNDGSTDDGETERVALSYNDKIDYYLKKNGGVASALNFGIDKMTGEYFSWLSHDDMYEKTKVEEEIGYLLSQPDSKDVIVACNSFTLFENGIKKREKIDRVVFNNYFDIFLGASAKVGLNGCSLLIPRRLLVQEGGFREDLPVTQDYELWYRLRESATFVHLDRNLIVYRHHAMQDSIRKFTTSLIAGDELRSYILQRVSEGGFANFISSRRGNKKWIWESYMTYRARGYIKASLSILYLLARYYGHGSVRDSRVKSEILTSERLYNHNLKRSGSENMPFEKKVKILIRGITDKDYKRYQGFSSGDRLTGYLESIKSDGLLFVIEKAARKLGRILRRS